MAGLGYSFLMPPTILIFGCLAFSALALFKPRPGARWAFAASLGLYVFSLPVFGQALLVWAATPVGSEANVEPGEAQAIVVLGAGIRVGNRGGNDALDLLSLERVACAARLYRRFHLPVAVTGGPLTGAKHSLGALMKDALEHEFSVPVSWTEEHSLTTFQNAEFTAALLKASGVSKVMLVTDAWHMPRAAWAFRHAGLVPVMYPSSVPAAGAPGLSDFLPSIKALQETFYGFHELLGLAYYRLRY